MLSEALCVVTALVIFAGTCCALFCLSPEARSKVVCGDGELYWDTLKEEHLTQDAMTETPLKIGIMRALFAAFVLGTTAFKWAQTGRWTLFTYFTTISWVLLGLYFVGVAYKSLKAAAGQGGPQDKPAGPFGKFLWVLCQQMFSIAVFICLLVWLVLIPEMAASSGWEAVSNAFFEWYGMSAHNMNVIFMLIEVMCNRLHFVQSHTLFAVLYANSYLFFSWGLFFIVGKFWYFFIDWTDMLTPIFYVVLALVLYGFSHLMVCISGSLKGGMTPESLPGKSSSSLQVNLPAAQMEMGSS